MKRATVPLLIAVICGLAPAACKSSESDDIVARLGSEGLPSWELLQAARGKKPPSDPYVRTLIDNMITDLRTKENAKARLGAARGLDTAAGIGYIGPSARVAAEALYVASRSDADSDVRTAAAGALKKVDDYRKGVVRPEFADLCERAIPQLMAPDPSARRSSVEFIGAAANDGLLGTYVLRVDLFLKVMAKDDPDPSVRAAASDALKKVDALRATLDLMEAPQTR